VSWLSETNVNIQNQITPFFRYFLMTEEKTDIVLTSQFAQDSNILNVSADHGITTNHWVSLWQNNRFFQAKVTNVATNAITVDRRSCCNFEVATTKIVRGKVDLNVDGSSTPVVFRCQLYNFSIPIDLTTFVLTMTHSAEADDSKFGGITAITSGLEMRFIDNYVFNWGIFKQNSDFRNYGGVVTYSNKAGGGTYATDINFNIESIFGISQVVRIVPNQNDAIQTTVNDNLSSLTTFRISILGHYTEGEG